MKNLRELVFSKVNSIKFFLKKHLPFFYPLLILLLFLKGCDNKIKLPQKNLPLTKKFNNACLKISSTSSIDEITILKLVTCINEKNEFPFLENLFNSFSTQDLSFIVKTINIFLRENHKKPFINYQNIHNTIDTYLLNLKKLIQNESFLKFNNEVLSFLQEDTLKNIINVTHKLCAENLIKDLKSKLNLLNSFIKTNENLLSPYRFNEHKNFAAAHSKKIVNDIYLLARHKAFSSSIIPVFNSLLEPYNFINFLTSLEIYNNNLISDALYEIKKDRTFIYSHLAPQIVFNLKKILPSLTQNQYLEGHKLLLYFKNLSSTGSWKKIEKKIYKEDIHVFAKNLYAARSFFINNIYNTKDFDVIALKNILDSFTYNNSFMFTHGVRLLYTHKLPDNTLLIKNIETLLLASNIELIPTEFGKSGFFDFFSELPVEVNNMSNMAFATLSLANNNQSIIDNLIEFKLNFSKLKNNTICSLVLKNCNLNFKYKRDIILKNFFCTKNDCSSYIDESGNIIFLYFKPFLRALSEMDLYSPLNKLFEDQTLIYFKNILLSQIYSNNFLKLIHFYIYGMSPENDTVTHQNSLIKLIDDMNNFLNTNSNMEKPYTMIEVLEKIIIKLTDTPDKRFVLTDFFMDNNSLMLFINSFPNFLLLSIQKDLFDIDENINHISSILRKFIKTFSKNENHESLTISINNGSLNSLMIDVIKFIQTIETYSK